MGLGAGVSITKSGYHAQAGEGNRRERALIKVFSASRMCWRIARFMVSVTVCTLDPGDKLRRPIPH